MTDPLSKIKLAPRAIRDVKGLDRQTRRRVPRALEALGADAANLGVKAVVGHAPWRRLRVGEHRVLYRDSPLTPTRDTWWRESSTGVTYTAPSTGSEPSDRHGAPSASRRHEMEPTEVDASRSALIPGGRMPLDEWKQDAQSRDRDALEIQLGSGPNRPFDAGRGSRERPSLGPAR
jgi:mRNA-degrading endonuclease RelE of RelBE toxin-antitoxin system